MLGQVRRIGLIAIAVFAAVQMATTQIVGPTDGGSGAEDTGGTGSGTRPPGAPAPGDTGTGTAPATCEAGPGGSTIPGSFIYDGGGAKNYENGVTFLAVGDGDCENVTTS